MEQSGPDRIIKIKREKEKKADGRMDNKEDRGLKVNKKRKVNFGSKLLNPTSGQTWARLD